MLETLLERLSALKRHLEAPLLKEREAFLRQNAGLCSKIGLAKLYRRGRRNGRNRLEVRSLALQPEVISRQKPRRFSCKSRSSRSGHFPQDADHLACFQKTGFHSEHILRGSSLGLGHGDVQEFFRGDPPKKVRS